MRFKRSKSSASVKVDDIYAFTYGPGSSRFWIMRKYINSLPLVKQKKLPFYAWECLTLHTKERDVNLVINNLTDMKYILNFLIISLQTVDGKRGTALPHLLTKKQIH